MFLKEISFCILTLILQISGKFLFPEYSKIFSNSLFPSQSYFGFSVQLYSSARANSSVIVGSPKSSDIYNLNIEQPGAIFRCSLNSEKCEQYNYDSGKDNIFLQGKRNSYLGYSLDIDTTTGKLLACAPRWTYNYMTKFLYPKLHGMCYTSDSTSGFVNISSFKDVDLQYHLNSYNYIFAEGGFASLIKDDTIVYTALGLLNWTGSIVQYDKKLNPIVITPDKVRSLETYSYFGYSLNYGNFNTSDLNKTFYVTGAPRTDNLTGRVYVYEQLIDFQTFTLRYEFPGRQFGEYFGGSLAVADINGDRINDIIIGAPMHSTENEEETGCIYPYITLESDVKIKFKKGKQIIGTKSGQRFGTAISSLGDINKDGCDDIAVGVPYYEGIGAVYIYLGQKNNGLKFDQIITASEIHTNLRGFGFSLSRGTDIDNNQSNDLAIGSYLSGHVVILKSKPIVDIKITLEASINEIGLTTKTFNLKSCVQYTTKQDVPDNINITVQITSDKSKITFNNKNEKNHVSILTYKKNIFQCENINVQIEDNISSDVKFTLNYDIYQGEKEEFCALCPIEDKDKQSITLQIPFMNGCDNSICIPNLKLSAIIDEEEIIIGAETELKIKIENFGQNAFGVKLFIQFTPAEISIESNEKTCTVLKENIICEFNKPLLTNSSWQFIFKLNTRNIPLNSKLFNITAMVTSKGEGENISDTKLLEKPFTTNLKYYVIPISKPEQILISSNVTDHHITHIFTIENTGITQLDSLNIYLSIPIKYNNEDILKNIKIFGCYDQNEEIFDAKYEMKTKETDNIINLNCTSTHTKNIICKKIKCELKDDSDYPKLEINYDVNITMFLNHEISTFLVTSLETDSAFLNIQSSAVTKLIVIPITGSLTLYIVIGIIVGVLLFLILMLILYKRGFFKRKRPPRVEETTLLEPKESGTTEENKNNTSTEIDIVKDDSE